MPGIDHLAPSHCHGSPSPTAQTSSLATATSPDRVPNCPAGGGVTVVQCWPSQCSNTPGLSLLIGRRPPSNPYGAPPAAHTSSAPTTATALSALYRPAPF